MSENYSLNPYQEDKTSRINKLTTLDDDQKKRVVDFFRKYPQDESSIDWNRKDLQWDDFVKVMDDRESKAGGKASKISKNTGLGGMVLGKEYMAHQISPDLTAYVPLTYKASRFLASSSFLGATADWCISYPNTNQYWNDYSGRDKVSFVIWVMTNANTPFSENGVDKFATAISPNARTENFDRYDNSNDLRRGTLTNKELIGYLGIEDITFQIIIEEALSYYPIVVEERKKPQWVTTKIFDDSDDNMLGMYRIHMENGLPANTEGDTLVIIYDKKEKEIKRIQKKPGLFLSFYYQKYEDGGAYKPKYIELWSNIDPNIDPNINDDSATTITLEYTLDGTMTSREEIKGKRTYSGQEDTDKHLITYYEDGISVKSEIKIVGNYDLIDNDEEKYEYDRDGSILSLHFRPPRREDDLEHIIYFPKDMGGGINEFLYDRESKNRDTSKPYYGFKLNPSKPWRIQKWNDGGMSTIDTRSDGPIRIDYTGINQYTWTWKDVSKGLSYFQIYKNDKLVQQFNTGTNETTRVEEFDLEDTEE